MQVFTGVSGAWNYTLGPALIYRGPSSIDQINLRPMPVVVVADYIPLEDLARIDMHHVYGFVLEGGGPGDTSRVFYSNQHRATVMQCAGALAAIRDDDLLVVDGVDGKVFVSPDDATVAKYDDLRLKGPPPEPEGFTDQLIKDALEMSQIKPEDLKALMDLSKIGEAVDIFMKMYQVDALADADVDKLVGMVQGSKYEDNVRDKLQVYQEAVQRMSPEELAERKARAPME